MRPGVRRGVRFLSIPMHSEYIYYRRALVVLCQPPNRSTKCGGVSLSTEEFLAYFANRCLFPNYMVFPWWLAADVFLRIRNRFIGGCGLSWNSNLYIIEHHFSHSTIASQLSENRGAAVAGWYVSAKEPPDQRHHAALVSGRMTGNE